MAVLESPYELLAHQHTPRVLSRQTHLDLPEGAESVYGELTSGTGLREAVEGVDAIIHCASSPQGALATDIGGTRMLVYAAREAGSPHFIYVSIVGIDRAQSGYYQAKYEAERIVMQSQLPWSIVRATQFHSFALHLIQSLGIEKLNVIPVPPNVRLQTIATGEVAERLLALAEGGETGQVEDMGGPQVLTLEEMIQTYLHVQGREVRMRAVDLPNSLFATFSSSER
ncbi:nucleotide-diphosphate-sugar epimerase [Ktedonobacter sp. SOSP1-52]|nr:nucleotide-diphosphate-sugar epimerase [Ktedonobacter sp. SOSP1-52]